MTTRLSAGLQEADVLQVGREDHFDFMSTEFSELYDRSSRTLFQHPVWLHHLYRTLAPAVGAEPVVLTVRAPDGRLLAVLPLVRRRSGIVRRVEFADLGVSDYAAPVLDRERGDAVLRDRTVSGAIRAAVGPVDLLRVDKVLGSPNQVAALLGAGQTVRHHYDGHSIPLPASFEAWRKERDPDFIRHIDGKRKRIGRRKRVLELRELTDPDEIDEAFARMREFRRARFADRRAIDLMQDPRYFEFYRQVAHHGALHGGPGSTTVLMINGETVAVSFGLCDDERDLFVLIGYDFDQWRNYSLGLVIVEELIAVSIAHDKRFHDLTVGHEDYKAAFGAVPTPVYSVRRPETMVGRAAKVAADQNVAARQLAKRALAYHAEHLKGRAPREALGLVRRQPAD